MSNQDELRRIELRGYERRALREVSAEARQAIAALRRVQKSSWLWADNVRECVEQQTGLGVTDERVIAVPAYAEVLELCAELNGLVDAVEQSLQRLGERPEVDVERQADTEREAER